MDLIFPCAASGEYHLSPSGVPGLLEKQVENRLTGAVQIFYPRDCRITLLYIQGEPVNVYRETPDGWQKIPPSDWPPLIGQKKIEVRVITLPVEGIRVMKMLLERPQEQGVFQLQTKDLSRRLDGWSTSPETILVRIKWPNAEAILVFPGQAMAVHPMVFVAEAVSATDKDALAAISAWKEPTCSVSIFADPEKKEAWEEYRLHQAFTSTAELMITRYSELAGRSLISVLNQDIDDETLRKGWRVSCVGNGILDHHIFSSPQEAANAYRALFRLILAHLNAVIGNRITDELVREVSHAIDSNSVEILEHFGLLASSLPAKIRNGRMYE